MKKILRDCHANNNSHYRWELDNGKVYSVVDFGKFLENIPKEIKEHSFQGWEAIEIKNDTLDCDNMIRSATEEGLLKEIC